MPRTDKAHQQQQWDHIVARPDTAEKHAAILEARRLHARHDPPDYALMIHTYQRAIDNQAFARLDQIVLTATDLTYLDQIVCAATTGVPARDVPAPVRTTLHQHLLIASVDAKGVQAWPSDTTGTVRALLFGVAVNRARRARPLPMSETEAIALAQLEADDGATQWPGSVEGRRIALYWKLVTHVDDRFRLTPTGRAALNDHRRNSPADTIVPSFEQSQVLRYLSRVNRAQGADLNSHPRDKVKVCVARQWIVRCGVAKDNPRRPLYRITESGRDALARWTNQGNRTSAQGTAVPLPVTAPRLTQGQSVRMMNRKAADLDPRWVVVDRTEQVPNPGRNPTWQVWVRDTDDGEPYLYGGRGFHPATRYEVRNTGTSAAA